MVRDSALSLKILEIQGGAPPPWIRPCKKIIYFHYSLDILKAQVMEHFKKFKQEKPEMDDFEEEKKFWF